MFIVYIHNFFRIKFSTAGILLVMSSIRRLLFYFQCYTDRVTRELCEFSRNCSFHIGYLDNTMHINTLQQLEQSFFVLFLLFGDNVWNTDSTVQPGTFLQLPSHNYPSYYPPDAYVLWTFQLATADDDIVYHISYGYVRIHYGDSLQIGYGWDPSDSLSLKSSYHGYYYGYPRALIIQSRNIYIEFDANSVNEWTGFEMSLNVQNTSGKKHFKIINVENVYILFVRI